MPTRTLTYAHRETRLIDRRRFLPFTRLPKFAKLVSALKVNIEVPSGEENEQLYAAIAELISHFDRVSVGRVANIVQAMKEEGTANVKQLDEVLSDWSLSQATSVLRETRRRVGMIELLRESLNNEKTFELKGDNSIHAILEQDLWLLDESYWMIQSNRTLKTFIRDRLSEKDAAKFGKKRPDFVCGNLGEQLIIVELKRPSHERIGRTCPSTNQHRHELVSRAARARAGGLSSGIHVGTLG